MTGRPVDAQRRQERQDAFLAAFAQTGILKRAAEQTGIKAQQHHAWVANDPGYAARFTQAKEEAGNLVAGSRLPHSRGYRQGGQRGAARQENQEKFLEALSRSGVAADAAREAGIAKGTYNQWMRVDPEFAKRAREVFTATEEQRARAMSERRSSAGRASWANPERRTEWARRQREEFWTPQRRAEWGERTTEIARSPEGRASRSAAGKKVWEDPEFRRRHGETMRQRWNDPEYKARMAEYTARPEVREARSRAARARWDALNPEQRKAHLKRMRSAMKGGYRLTKIEAMVLVALNSRDLPYFVHKPVGGYVADILIPSLKLIIECDGAYYHELRREGDEARDAALLALGYETIRLSEEEINGRQWDRLDEAVTRLA